MKKIDQPTTRTRLIRAAIELFSERGYAGTSIGRIEERAGLAPRAGGFYRHFKSKDDLLEAIMDAEIDTPETTGAAASFDLGDTRAELVAVGRAYLDMNRKNRDLARVLDRESPRTATMQQKIQAANEEAMASLANWVGGKPACTHLEPSAIHDLTIMIFGGWFFYIHKTVHERIELPQVDDDTLLKNWATFWAAVLDDENHRALPQT